jgi:hypothetical protein
MSRVPAVDFVDDRLGLAASGSSLAVYDSGNSTQSPGGIRGRRRPRAEGPPACWI